jgi:thioredoxin 2
VNTSDIAVCEVCGKKNRVPAAATGVPRCGNCHAALPWIAVAGDAEFADVVESAALPVLVDLWAPWCGPCRMVTPALEQLAREYAGKVKLVKVDVDQAVGVSRRFDVRGVPTLLVMDKGRVISQQVGAAPEPALRTWLDDALARDASQINAGGSDS